MLRDGADSLWCRLIDAAVDADSWEAVELALAALKAESSWRRGEHDKAEQEHRAKSGAPAHFASVSAEAMQAALDDVASWAGVPRETTPDPDEAQE